MDTIIFNIQMKEEEATSTGTWGPRISFQISSAMAFGGSRRILLSLLASGYPTVARGPHAPVLIATALSII
jgi:hypothetical protein